MNAQLCLVYKISNIIRDTYKCFQIYLHTHTFAHMPAVCERKRKRGTEFWKAVRIQLSLSLSHTHTQRLIYAYIHTHTDPLPPTETHTHAHTRKLTHILTSVLRAFLLKKALHDSHVMASKLWANALSPHTRQTFSSSRGRFLCFFRHCDCDASSPACMLLTCVTGGSVPVAFVRSITMARATASLSADRSGSGSGSVLGVWSRTADPSASASSMLGDRSRGVESGEAGSETHNRRMLADHGVYKGQKAYGPAYPYNCAVEPTQRK